MFYAIKLIVKLFSDVLLIDLVIADKNLNLLI